jgi:hypothetical protein
MKDTRNIKLITFWGDISNIAEKFQSWLKWAIILNTSDLFLFFTSVSNQKTSIGVQ